LKIGAHGQTFRSTPGQDESFAQHFLKHSTSAPSTLPFLFIINSPSFLYLLFLPYLLLLNVFLPIYNILDASERFPAFLWYTHKTSGFKTSGFKTSGFKTSGFKTSGLQNVRFTKLQVSKRQVSKRPIFKFVIPIQQKV
jgi:hypothetical protein